MNKEIELNVGDELIIKVNEDFHSKDYKAIVWFDDKNILKIERLKK